VVAYTVQCEYCAFTIQYTQLLTALNVNR